jgi:hypothetical protein
VGFRDDREANVQRLDALERELASTKNELEAALLRAAEVDDLRKRVVDLGNERDALKRGVEPGWASRNQTLRYGIGVLGLAIVGAGFVAWSALRHQMTAASTAQTLAESQAASCDAERERLQNDLGATRSELAQIDATNDGELHDLRGQLRDAVSHRAGPALVVTAHVTARSGNVPAGATDDCAMTVREASGRVCIATVVCGPTQVFPLVLPPDVVCIAEGGGLWTAASGVPLASATARIDSIPDALLEYDAAAHALIVRETAANGFTLRMTVRETLPYLLR